MGLCGERGKFYDELVEDLIVFAEQEFRGSKKLGDGATQRDHDASAARQWEKLGRKVKAPASGPVSEPPALLVYLWEWFCEISMGLAVSGMAPPVITWEGLAAWRAQMGVDLEPWEARTVVRMSCLRASILSEEKPKPPPSPNGRQSKN